MLQTSARVMMTGLAAVTLGALSGWVLIDKLYQKPMPSAARAASMVVNADQRKPAAATLAPASAPAAEAPIRVAAPARAPAVDPAPAPAPAATPASDTSGKPRINIDKDRGEASLEVGDASVSASKDGKLRIKLPGGVSYDIDW